MTRDMNYISYADLIPDITGELYRDMDLGSLTLKIKFAYFSVKLNTLTSPELFPGPQNFNLLFG